MQMTIPQHLASIRENREKHPEFVPWPPEHDLAVAACTAAAYVLGLEQHLVLDAAGEAAAPSRDGKLSPVDTGGMFR